MAATADRGRDVLLPNLLSLARVPLAGLLWIAPTEPLWTLPVVSIAGVTDVLDGWLARRARRRRHRDADPGAFAASAGRGAFIDGFADKVFVVSAVFVLALTLHPPVWALVLLASRELLFVPLMLTYRLNPAEKRARVDFSAGPLGKLATLTQFAALVLGLLGHSLFVPSTILAGIVGTVAALEYSVRAYQMSHAR
jgi:phosphatidylglycerophosphate synthase